MDYMSKKLILYYSQARGNTKRIAEMIQKVTRADMEAIDTVEPYPDDYQTVVAQGQDEVNRGYKPEIKTLNHNPNDYDELIIATPTWWYTMAPAVHTLLSKLDVTGKKVILLQTHGGWPGHTIKDMEKLCKSATDISSFMVKFDSTGGDHLETDIKEIEDWIKSL